MNSADALQLRLDAPHPTIEAVHTTNDNDGSVRYQLCGPRLIGSITITGQRWPDTDFPVQATIDLGYQPHPDGPVHDRPTVNGIQANGSVTIDLTTLDQLTPSFLRPYRARYHNGDNHLPATSSRYLGAAALAVARHWSSRPDRETLMLATARYYAPRRLHHLQKNTISRLREKVDQTTRELDDALRLAAFLQALAEGTDPRTAIAPDRPDDDQTKREQHVLALLLSEGHKISDALRAFAEREHEAAEHHPDHHAGHPVAGVGQRTIAIAGNPSGETAERLAASAADAVRLANEIDDFADGGRR